MNKPLNGIKIIDFTHVQAGPACTQLQDIPGVDALYFTMLNSNKKSLTLDTKKPAGKEVLEKQIGRASCRERVLASV